MRKNAVRVSVIVPVYNVASYLPACLESLLNQKMSNIEFILVDDGSTDESGAICDDYGRKDSRIVVLHKKNGGLSSARNAGIEKARGKYIGFVDGDDWVSPDMYEALYSLAEKHQAQIAAGRFCETGSGIAEEISCTSSVTVLKPEDTLKKFFLRQITESVCDKLFLKSLFDNVFFPDGEINEDTAVFVKLVMKSEKNIFLDKTLYFYRKREGSITKSGYSCKFLVVDRHLHEIELMADDKYPELKPYREYFFGVHYYCLLLSVLKDWKEGEYYHDYVYYLQQFRRYFPAFMKRGTGKQKDRLLALILFLRCGRLLYSVIK